MQNSTPFIEYVRTGDGTRLRDLIFKQRCESLFKALEPAFMGTTQVLIDGKIQEVAADTLRQFWCKSPNGSVEFSIKPSYDPENKQCILLGKDLYDFFAPSLHHQRHHIKWHFIKVMLPDEALDLLLNSSEFADLAAIQKPDELFIMNLRNPRPMAAMLMQVTNFPQLQLLQISDDSLNVEMMQVIVEKLLKTKIHTLDLQYRQISTQAPVILANALPRTQIHTLNLVGNKLDNEGVMALANALPRTQIKQLRLNNSVIIAERLIILASVLPKTKIRTLDLSNNPIEGGLYELAEVLPNTEIHSLNLSCCHSCMSSMGFSKLVEALPKSKIHTLNLSHNLIKCSEAEALAKILPDSDLRTLDLSDNFIEHVGLKAIVNALPRTKLQSLSLDLSTQTTAETINDLILCLLQSNSLLEMTLRGYKPGRIFNFADLNPSNTFELNRLRNLHVVYSKKDLLLVVPQPNQDHIIFNSLQSCFNNAISASNSRAMQSNPHLLAETCLAFFKDKPISQGKITEFMHNYSIMFDVAKSMEFCPAWTNALQAGNTIQLRHLLMSSSSQHGVTFVERALVDMCMSQGTGNPG